MNKLIILILKFLPQKIKNQYFNGTERSQGIIKNIMVSLIMKAANILSSLLIVPLTINYVNPTQYGIWLTLSSVIGWLTFFDLGLGNGFRNRFAEAKAKGNLELARQYLSTTYLSIALIVFCVLSIGLFLNQYINWSSFLKVSTTYQEELSRVFAIVCFFTCTNMVANVFGTLLTADQKPSLTAVIHAIGQYLSLFVIFLLTKISTGNLTNLAMFYSGIPCIVMLVVSILMFNFSKYKVYRPSFKYVKLKLIKDIMQLGVQFFFIYLCIIAIFQIINLVITREIGPVGVTQYTIANKYFNIMYMFLVVVVTPLWSAFTDAYTKHDYLWMQNMVKKMEKLWLLSMMVGVIMLVCSTPIYSFWVGSSVDIPFSLSCSMLLLVLSQSLGSIYMYMINGIGCIRIQMIIYIFFALFSWPLFTYFGNRFGLIGITIVPTLVYFLQALIGRIQLYKIISKEATGIWMK